MCAEGRLKTASASTQSDQSIICPHQDSLNQTCPKMRCFSDVVAHILYLKSSLSTMNLNDKYDMYFACYI